MWLVQRREGMPGPHFCVRGLPARARMTVTHIRAPVMAGSATAFGRRRHWAAEDDGAEMTFGGARGTPR
ncbi:hypothetical protein E2562_026313 [Oryza meyeriana var. granulata]|uniref:Uncharacterized protein n=1 Tax=Oryza meyeriana var. granulata TaxID=110450 RepID=A0A6G1C9A0_9ORYZ|nr:hypothetical protein E2562_026313 [Oryza meyeriana var. granulata]